MTFNIMLRHKVVKFIRRYLEDDHGFVEVPSLNSCLFLTLKSTSIFTAFVLYLSQNLKENYRTFGPLTFFMVIR